MGAIAHELPGDTERLSLSLSDIAWALGLASVSRRLDCLELQDRIRGDAIQQAEYLLSDAINDAFGETGKARFGLGAGLNKLRRAAALLDRPDLPPNAVLLRDVVYETGAKIEEAIAERAPEWPMPAASEAATLQLRLHPYQKWETAADDSAETTDPAQS